MSAATHAPHGNLYHPAPLTPILLQHLRDQEQISGAQNRQSWSSFSGQGALADRFHRGRYEPPQASYGSFMPPPLHPLCDAHAHAGMEEAMTPLDYSLCSEASLVYNDIGELARVQVHPSTALKIRSAEPRHIHSLVQQHAHALMVYHAALELHRTTSRVLTDMRSKRDAVFGPGVWIMDHFPQLNEAQQAAVDNAMGNWDDEYIRNWPLIAQSLTVLEPC